MKPVQLLQLLIVPYGIETPDASQPAPDSQLLIVPYGIETHKVIVRIEV